MLFSKGNIRMKLVAGAVLMCVASAAGAVTLTVGGATLPAVGYTGSPTFPAPLTPITTMGTGSLFGAYLATTTGVSVSYCPTGSGNGKKILAGNDSNFQVNATCGAVGIPPTVIPTGFGGASVAQADFAGSDAPFSLTEYTNYKTGHSGSLPTQLPSIAGAIGIVFKKTGVNALTLSEDQICGVFSGQITDWSALASGVSGPINIAYRSDNSGTSFSFLNHLSKVCPTVPTHVATSFKTLQGYATGAASYISAYSSSVGASGNAGVVAAVGSTSPDGSIGYAEVANGVAAGVKMASVTNTSGATINPLTGFGPTAVSVSVVFDKAIADSPDGTTGRPILVNLPDTGTCVGLVDPDTYANPASGYPILAITNLLGNSTGNGANVTAVRGILGAAYNATPAFRNTVTKIGRATTGYAWLSNAAGVLSQAKVDSCIN
jgi:phosphate transport system substrate-binding protein